MLISSSGESVGCSMGSSDVGLLVSAIFVVDCAEEKIQGGIEKCMKGGDRVKGCLSVLITQ